MVGRVARMGSGMTPSTLDLEALRRSLAALDGAIGVVADRDWFDRQTPNVRATLLAGVIQHFEFVYEISVKMIKRRVELDSANPSEIDTLSFRDLLRVAAETGIITDVGAWFAYRQLRNITAHTYDQAKALAIQAEIGGFSETATALLARLEALNG